jgi:hypothetical protein
MAPIEDNKVLTSYVWFKEPFKFMDAGCSFKFVCTCITLCIVLYVVIFGRCLCQTRSHSDDLAPISYDKNKIIEHETSYARVEKHNLYDKIAEI